MDESTSTVEPALEPQPKRAAAGKKRPRRQPRYQVVLWNDEDHTFEYVVTMLAQLFGHPKPRGYQLALEVHTQGRASILTTTREHAELKRDQVHAFGKDQLIATCQGSMKATIEPVPGT